MQYINIDMECNLCGNMIFICVPKDEYDKYKDGTLAQHAFKSLTATEREYLISGICKDCQDEVLSE